jgi:hypothetical protein
MAISEEGGLYVPVLSDLHDVPPSSRTDSTFVQQRLAGEPRIGGVTNIPSFTANGESNSNNLLNELEELKMLAGYGPDKESNGSKKTDPMPARNHQAVLGSDFMKADAGTGYSFGSNYGALKHSNINASAAISSNSGGGGYGDNSNGVGAPIDIDKMDALAALEGGSRYTKQARYQPGGTSASSNTNAHMSVPISSFGGAQGSHVKMGGNNKVGAAANLGAGNEFSFGGFGGPKPIGQSSNTLGGGSIGGAYSGMGGGGALSSGFGMGGGGALASGYAGNAMSSGYGGNSALGAAGGGSGGGYTSSSAPKEPSRFSRLARFGMGSTDSAAAMPSGGGGYGTQTGPSSFGRHKF